MEARRSLLSGARLQGNAMNDQRRSEAWGGRPCCFDTNLFLQAEEKVRTHASDLMFLRDQITTTEVRGCIYRESDNCDFVIVIGSPPCRSTLLECSTTMWYRCVHVFVSELALMMFV